MLDKTTHSYWCHDNQQYKYDDYDPSSSRHIDSSSSFEPYARVELAFSAWKAETLPLS